MESIHHENLHAVAREIVAAAGSVDEEPGLVADNLVYANLTGHDSHGVGMLPAYMDAILTGELSPNRHAQTVVDHGAMLVIDGQAGYGQVIGLESMEIGIERAREHGVCVLAIRNSFHLCRIGAWGEQCARAGLVSMHHVNAVGNRPLVAPFGANEARYATNPYCCTLPGTDSNPSIVLDFATTVMAMGKVRVAKNKGEALPDGVLFDGEGKPTNDPNAMYTEPRGALRPLGEHKGYALALVNELLGGALAGGQTARPETRHPNPTIINNMLSIIIDPSRLVDPATYETEVDASLAYIRSAQPEDPNQPVLIPGDPERRTMEERIEQGVPIDAESWRQLKAAGESVGVEGSKLEALAGD